jgi:integrase
MEEYIAWKKLVAAKSYIQTVVTLVNFHIIPRLATLPAEEFNGEHLRKFVKDVLETPPKPGNASLRPRRSIETLDEEALRKRKGTVNTLIGILRIAMRMAWENGKIENSRGWQTLRRIPNVSRARLTHLSRPECKRLLAHCKPDLARLVLGGLYTGCRITELLRMQACDVGRDGYGIYVKPSKTYKPRFVFLPDEGMAFFLMLAKGKSPSDLLFLRDNGKDWYFYQRHALKTAVIATGLPANISFHSLRHTYASQLVQAGAPLIVVSEQLGHANITCVSQTYGHLSPQIREAEVRQRYTSVDPGLARIAVNQKKSLDRWRRSLHGGRWESYATISDVRSKLLTR